MEIIDKSKESPRGEVPIYHKLTLTIKEAAEYSNIGINKIESLLKQPNCPICAICRHSQTGQTPRV